MPSHPCKHPTCCEYVQRPATHCPEHQEQGKRERSAAGRFYDQHRRNKHLKPFYNSAAWQRARRTKLAEHPVCERCGVTFAEHVHHVRPLALCTLAERTAQSNLMALCRACHTAIEREG